MMPLPTFFVATRSLLLALWYSLVLLALTTTAALAQGVVTVDSNNTIALKPYLSYWIPGYDISPEIAVKNRAKFQLIRNPAIPATNQDVWYQFTVKATAPYHNQLLLNFNEVLFDFAEVFFQVDGKWRSYASGLRIPSNSTLTPINYRFIVVPIRLPANEEASVFFRVHSLPNVIVAPELQTPKGFFESSIKYTSLSSAILSAFLFMVVYAALLIRPLIGSIQFIVFLGFLLSVMANILLFDGHLTKVTGGREGLNLIMYTLVTSLLNIFSLLFSRYFFALKEQLPVINHLVSVLVSLYVLILLVALFIDPKLIGSEFLRYSALVTLLLIIIAADVLRREEPGAYYFVAAMGCYVTSVVYSLLISTGAVDFNQANRFVIYCGTTLFGLFILLAVNRIALLQREQAVEKRHQQDKAQIVQSSLDQFYQQVQRELIDPFKEIDDNASLLENSRLDTLQKRHIKAIKRRINDIQQAIQTHLSSR